MEDAVLIKIEVVFALAKRQRLLSLVLADETTAREAVLACKLASEFPEFDFATCPLGIWGKTVDDSQRLVSGDRVEVYRPLRRDPRDARRKLALQGRSIGQRETSGSR